jgi:hypothetical protein
MLGAEARELGHRLAIGAAGNRLHFAESGPDGCIIDMTLLGRYIGSSDNGLCGGPVGLLSIKKIRIDLPMDIIRD